MSGIVQQIALREPKLTANEESLAAEDEFGALVHRQSRFVFCVAYSVLRNVQDAEDTVQDVFTKLYRTGAWRNIRDEPAFLARAGWRLAVERLARTKAPYHSNLGTIQQPTPEEALIAADRDAAVQRLVDALPDDLRLPLALSALHELRSQDIAAIMGIPDGTVRTRIARARRILKEKMAVLMEGGHVR